MSPHPINGLRTPPQPRPTRRPRGVRTGSSGGGRSRRSGRREGSLPETRGSRVWAGRSCSEKEALLVPMLVVDPGPSGWSRRARIPCHVRPLETAPSLPSRWVRSRHHLTLFTGNEPAAVSPIPVSPAGGARRPTERLSSSDPGTHRDRSLSRVCDASWLMAALPSQVPDGGPDGESLEERVPACLPRPADQRRRQGAGPCSEPHDATRPAGPGAWRGEQKAPCVVM